MTDATVDSYLAGLAEAERTSLEALRSTIRSLAPDAVECISYGAPGYRIEGGLVAGFAVAKHHLSYLPHSGSVLSELEAELAGYSWSKGTLRFDIGATLPRPLVQKLLATRRAEIEGTR